MSSFIEIVEVGPRDGLQNEKAVLEAPDKVDFIRRLEACGARRIEAVSFVNERRVPQMAGAEAIMAALPHQDGRSRIGLVLNERGWDRALAARRRRGQRGGLRHRRLRHPQPGRAGGRADGGAGGDRGAPQGRGRAADQRHDIGGVRLPVRWRGPRGAGGGAGPRRRRARRGRDRARRHHRRRRPLDGEAAHRGGAQGRAERPAAHALPRYPQHRPRQRIRLGRGRRQRARRQLRRPRRLPVRARRHRQHRHRGPGLHAGARGLRDRLRSWRADRGRTLDRRADRQAAGFGALLAQADFRAKIGRSGARM